MRLPVLATIAAGLLAAAPASAGVLATPPLPISNAAGQRAVCAVANSGKKDLFGIKIKIFKSSAIVADSIDAALLAGGTSAVIADAAELGVTSYVRCQVEGTGISKAKTHVTLCVMPSGSFECLVSATAP